MVNFDREKNMTTIHIDEATCKKDSFCVQECPVAIIKQEGPKTVPKMIPGGSDLCIECGHCVAVCPHGALNHLTVPLEDCPAIVKENIVNKEQAIQFLRSRRSVRTFKQKAVETQQIEELIRVARYAPTGSNAQDVQWTVMTDQEKIKKVSKLTVAWMRQTLENAKENSGPSYLPGIIAAWDKGVDVVLRDAPVLIIASTPGASNNGMVDLSIALSYLELAAYPCGLGTCWAGLAQQALAFFQPLKDHIGLPESHTNAYPMMLGYPKFRFHRLPERKAPHITWQ
jgi:nitroreductase/NAD-dependent dihydropyrimidine dehydrogenase PreA subunit